MRWTTPAAIHHAYQWPFYWAMVEEIYGILRANDWTDQEHADQWEAYCMGKEL